MRPSPLRAFAECARKERPYLLAVVNSNARSKPDHPGENRRSDSNRSTYRAVDGRGAAAGWLRKTTGGCNFCNVEYFVQSKTMEWEDCLQEGSHEASDGSLVLLHSALTGRMASAGMLSLIALRSIQGCSRPLPLEGMLDQVGLAVRKNSSVNRIGSCNRPGVIWCRREGRGLQDRRRPSLGKPRRR